MSKRTVVSNYIKDKFNNIKKDSFLEEVSKLSVVNQKEAIIKEVDNINYYIKMIKNNDKYYEKINGNLELNVNIKKYIHNLKQIIIKYQEYYKYLCLLEYYDTRKDRIKEKIEFESSQIKLTEDQIVVLNNLNDSNISSYDFNVLANIVKYLIQHFTIDKLDLINLILKQLQTEFIDNNYSDEYFIAISSIKNILTYKINYLDKNDDNRKLLKEIKKYVKSIIDYSKEKEKQEHDYCIDILNILLDNELYIQKIIQRSSKLLNLIDEDNRTIAYFAIAKYLDLYLLELKGRQSSIPKEKYLDIYYMIELSSNYKYKDIDKVKIEELTNNFKETIKNSGFKREKYLEVVKKLDEDLNKTSTTNKQELNKELIDFENQNILNSSNIDHRKDLTNEYTIIVDSKKLNLYNYAYSINKKSENNYILKLHITDVSKDIKSGSYLDEMLKNTMFKDEVWLDEKILSKLSLNKNKISPVITIECEVLENGKITNLKSYRSNILVDDIYSLEEFNSNMTNKNIFPFVKIGKILNKELDKSNCGKSLMNTFEKCILTEIGKYFDDHNYPYIYKIQYKQNSDEYIKLLTKLNYLFSKIKKMQMYFIT